MFEWDENSGPIFEYLIGGQLPDENNLFGVGKETEETIALAVYVYRVGQLRK